MPIASRAKKKSHKFRKTDLYTVGTYELKDRLLKWLNNSDPNQPGHIRLPETTWCDMDFVSQLCAEKKIYKIINGVPRPYWIIDPPSQRNEQTDIFVYANAAMYLYDQNYQKMIAEQLAFLNDQEVEDWDEVEGENSEEVSQESLDLLEEFEAEMEDSFYEVDV